jgi:hypothetical protein
VINSGRAAYTFGKSLTSVLVSVFAAPAASALQLVSSIVEAVSGFVYMLFQGLTFKAATDKCREWVKVGDITQDLQLNESIAGCPFIGVLFFGAANYIGHFNLTAMLTKPQLLTSTNLQLAVSQVSGVQKVACQYFKSTEVPYRLVDSNYEWILKMMRGMASSAPRSEFLTEDASAKAKFRHYGKKGLRTVMTGMKKVYSWMG